MHTLNSVQTAVEWVIRPYRESDLSATVALDNFVSAADGLDIVLTDEEQQVNLSKPGFDPTRKVLVVEGPRLEGVQEGMLLGYGMLPSEDKEAGERVYSADIYVHPAARDHGLQRELARRLVEIAKEDANSSGWSGKTELRMDFSEKQPYLKVLSTEAGLKLVRQFWIMECPLANLDEPKPVDGVTMRSYNVPGDHPGAMEAYNQSFCDHFGFIPYTLDRWGHRFDDPTIKPESSWVAEIDGETGKFAGFCLCNVYEEENKALNRCEGWIALLGTTRDWRGKGLGRALLLHGLHSLRSSGLDTGVLGVDSTSPTGANHLYESVGFRTREIWFQYRATLADVQL